MQRLRVLITYHPHHLRKEELQMFNCTDGDLRQFRMPPEFKGVPTQQFPWISIPLNSTLSICVFLCLGWTQKSRTEIELTYILSLLFPTDGTKANDQSKGGNLNSNFFVRSLVIIIERRALQLEGCRRRDRRHVRP